MSPRALRRSVATGALSSACAMGLLATSGWLITTASTRPPVYVLSVAIGAVQAFALGRGLFRYLQRLSVHDVSLGALGRLRLRLYDDLEPLVPGGLPPDGTGGVLNSFVADADAVATGLVQATTAAVDTFTSVVLGAAVAALLVPGAALVLLAGSAAVVALAFTVSRFGRSAADREASLRGELAASVVDTMRSARELVAYGREDLVEDRLQSVGRRAAAAAMRQAGFGAASRALNTWVTGFAVMGVAMAAVSAHSHHQVSGVTVAVVVFVALATFDPLSSLPAVLADTSAARSAADRLGRLSRLATPVHEPAQDGSPDHGPVATGLVAAGVTALDGSVMLGRTSLEVTPGARVALVGPNGAGKTTALHALMHFVDCTEGRAVVGGTDVRQMTREGIARHLGWMSETPHVFAASVADNLRIAHPSATDGDCTAALTRVGLASWLESLPSGLSTIIGSGGRPLSAGESQKLGLARALLAGGSVLLLDEPTAHVDPASSARVLTDILAASGGRSVLVVSHEPDIADYVDRVVTVTRSSRG